MVTIKGAGPERRGARTAQGPNFAGPELRRTRTAPLGWGRVDNKRVGRVILRHPQPPSTTLPPYFLTRTGWLARYFDQITITAQLPEFAFVNWIGTVDPL